MFVVGTWQLVNFFSLGSSALASDTRLIVENVTDKAPPLA